MQNTLNDVITFVKSPHCTRDHSYTLQQKLTTLTHILVFSFIVAILLGMLISIFGHFQIIDLDNHANTKLFEEFSPLVILFLVAVVAPVIEELIFRAPITLFCKYKPQFKYIFYAFALAFGYVHLFNFEISLNIILLSPILVLPQILLGFFLGYLRLKFGLLYAIILHALYNGILTIPVLLFGDLINV